MARLGWARAILSISQTGSILNYMTFYQELECDIGDKSEFYSIWVGKLINVRRV